MTLGAQQDTILLVPSLCPHPPSCRPSSPPQFFLAPSLTTGKGDIREGPGFSRHGIHRMGPPVAVLELRYETATTLLLRGVLKANDPVHRGILQQFPGGSRKLSCLAAGPHASWLAF